MLISLSETYKREGRLAEALEVLENGALKSPASTGIHLAIAKSSEEAGDFLKASMALEDVLRLDPGNPYALKTLRDIKIREKGWSEAAAYQRKLMDSSRDDGARDREKTLLAAIIYEDAASAAEDGRLDEATTLARESLRHDPRFTPSDILTSEILYRRGKVAEAISVLEDSLGKSEEPYPLLLKIEDLCIKKSAPDKALDRYRKEVYTHPGDLRMRQLLARLYLRLEMVGQAVEELERLYNESGDDYYTKVLLGAAYLRNGEADRAALLFAKALMLEGDLSPIFKCSVCDAAAGQWAARCPACGEWNTLEMGGPRQRGGSVSRMIQA
jgi:predicted Zn-dependent protease